MHSSQTAVSLLLDHGYITEIDHRWENNDREGIPISNAIVGIIIVVTIISISFVDAFLDFSNNPKQVFSSFESFEKFVVSSRRRVIVIFLRIGVKFGEFAIPSNFEKFNTLLFLS